MAFEYLKFARRQHRETRRSQRGRSLHAESLEPRIQLDGDGFLTGTDVHLSLSFAADGVEIAGHENSLAAKFDTIAPTAVWQEVILRAFQTWAAATNGDIGVTNDNGDSFGSPGPSQKDSRFGDIRIGAIDMSPEIGAVSVPVDGLVSGTWFADVVFNSSYDYQTLGDIYAIALHEAGNVFGLEDSGDPSSPLFTGGAPTGLLPTSADVAALQQLHGARLPDANESSDGKADNDTFANATVLELLRLRSEDESEDGGEGSAPSVIYGDITSSSDRDFFVIEETPGNYSGSLTVQVRSNGISLLTPHVRIYSASQQVLAQTVSFGHTGDTVTLQIPAIEPGQKYYIEVAGANVGLYGIGGYSLTSIFDGINQVSQPDIDLIAGGQYRFLEADEFEEFFDADDDDLLGDDAHSDDTSINATELETAVGFLEANRYEVVGSIADKTDVDHYRFKSPKVTDTLLDVMTVLLRSIDEAGLVPKMSVFDSEGQLVPFTILANGGGESIIQVDGVSPDEDFEIKVAAHDPNGPFNTGNYTLAITFGSQATQLASLAAGSVGSGATQSIHTLYVGQPQLFHFALEVEPAPVSVPTALVAAIKNDRGESVYRIASQPGETRTREAVLLAPGTYKVEMIPFSLDGSVLPELAYTLLGSSISDPFVGDPDDPDAHPFECDAPELEGFFCYPGDFVSPDPFLFDSFVESLSAPPDQPDLVTLASSLLGDWWGWVWEQAGINGPPLGVDDAIHVPGTPEGSATLLLGPNSSVLDNDIDPEGDPLVAILQSRPENGSLGIEADGTFTYTPNVGFQGRDVFSYTAFDFTQESAPTTVTIIVGESGDFDADGGTDGADFLAWQRNFTVPAGAVLTDGDSDFDGDVDGQDLAFWQSTFGAGAVAAAATSESMVAAPAAMVTYHGQAVLLDSSASVEPSAWARTAPASRAGWRAQHSALEAFAFEGWWLRDARAHRDVRREAYQLAKETRQTKAALRDEAFAVFDSGRAIDFANEIVTKNVVNSVFG